MIGRWIAAALIMIGATAILWLQPMGKADPDLKQAAIFLIVFAIVAVLLKIVGDR
jgi:ABC-type Mn2+/Zn2+ transport system permease subunit